MARYGAQAQLSFEAVAAPTEKRMRRIAVFREGNMMGAIIGPDLVIGLGGFGNTVSDALRNLADYFDEHKYRIGDSSVQVEIRGKRICASGKTPSVAIRKLAWIIVEGGYVEKDFAEPDWSQIAVEPPVVSDK